MYLNTLGSFLQDDVLVMEIIPRKQKALDFFLEALRHVNSPPLDRIKAGQSAFDRHVAGAEWANANVAARNIRLEEGR
ncbi:hypothetical protein EYZ11_004104 [Aspergillus tanneri]|uniref:Uncharacterized protein n=1 Tax=Aspergillus tanneri TaxID=1220188 RepID=A0A4S3JNR7_9EURO|nr:hypothetical protein EYZ11_004104 [Aspergillus tanneri]